MRRLQREKIHSNREVYKSVKSHKEPSKSILSIQSCLSFYEDCKHLLQEMQDFLVTLEPEQAKSVAILSAELSFEDQEGELTPEAVKAF